MRFFRRLGGASAFLIHVLWTASQIHRSAAIPDKGATLGAYLKLKSKHFLTKLFPGLRFKRETLFGYPVVFFDYFTLVCIFETVFVYRDYCFQPATNRPFILDCGSNIGLSVLYFKRQFPESRVIAFEPDPDTFAALEKNAAGQGWRDVELHNCAVYARTGEVEFHYDPEQPGAVRNSVDGDTGPAVRRVPAVALSEFIREEVDFLKLDVEGAEMAVLEEVARSGKLRNIRAMAVEYHHHMVPTEDRFSELLRLLEDNGYGYVLHDTPERPFARGQF
ncbi:MAG: FkbM family methyltransferase [Acidobacteria bacterium]|nr:FkbM family methyltransferase [Acidobacteriota bacterium]